jgi:hypothetical protein
VEACLQQQQQAGGAVDLPPLLLLLLLLLLLQYPRFVNVNCVFFTFNVGFQLICICEPALVCTWSSSSSYAVLYAVVPLAAGGWTSTTCGG